MTRALVCAALLLLVAPAHAATFASFHVPKWSADSACTPLIGFPAGVAKIRVWALNATPGRFPYNVWVPIMALNIRAGSRDGAPMRFLVPSFVAIPGDSIGVRVAVCDSALNWNCADAVRYGRAK